jgi:hypothetical protein
MEDCDLLEEMVELPDPVPLQLAGSLLLAQQLPQLMQYSRAQFILHLFEEMVELPDPVPLQLAGSLLLAQQLPQLMQNSRAEFFFTLTNMLQLKSFLLFIS